MIPSAIINLCRKLVVIEFDTYANNIPNYRDKYLQILDTLLFTPNEFKWYNGDIQLHLPHRLDVIEQGIKYDGKLYPLVGSNNYRPNEIDPECLFLQATKLKPKWFPVIKTLAKKNTRLYPACHTKLENLLIMKR